MAIKPGRNMSLAITFDGQSWEKWDGLLESLSTQSHMSDFITSDLRILHTRGNPILLEDAQIYSSKPAIVKCGHCGQWAARFTACRFCGAPVD